MNVYIVIPTYNEEGTVREVINSIKNEDLNYNIVVVDDNSSDNTVARVQETDAAVLRHIINRGQGAALRTGTEYAIMKGAEAVVHFDADEQFLASEIKEVIAPIINNRADMVFGSRFLSKQSNIPWFKRNVILLLARLVNRWFFNIRLSDPQAGFRAMSGAVARKINWRQDRMAHCSEIMHQAFAEKLRIEEVPITVIYRDFGQKFFGGLKILKEMFIGAFTK